MSKIKRIHFFEKELTDKNPVSSGIYLGEEPNQFILYCSKNNKRYNVTDKLTDDPELKKHGLLAYSTHKGSKTYGIVGTDLTDPNTITLEKYYDSLNGMGGPDITQMNHPDVLYIIETNGDNITIKEKNGINMRLLSNNDATKILKKYGIFAFNLNEPSKKS